MFEVSKLVTVYGQHFPSVFLLPNQLPYYTAFMPYALWKSLVNPSTLKYMCVYALQLAGLQKGIRKCCLFFQLH